ncbi:MAG: hypothetical protein ACRDXB_09765, partial [Actinomycetes bacterium]
AYAARGNTAACDRALGQAIERFSAIDPATTPPWGACVGEAGISDYQGAAYYTLALTGRDPRAAERVVPLLRHAVDHFDPDYARPRVLYLPSSATA